MPRHFVLAPIPAKELNTNSNGGFSVEVGFVKMPAYLLRDSLLVRTSANEIEYLQNAFWAERLDQSLERTLTVNLRGLAYSNSSDLPKVPREQTPVKVLLNVEQFDVDTHGQGVLIARWRVIGSDSNKQLNAGHARLVRTAPAPRGKPDIIATTLSDLTANLSREIAKSVSEPRRTLGSMQPSSVQVQ